MARISLNVDQAAIDNAATQFEVVPAGRYKVSIFDIKDAEVGSGDNKGKLRLKFQFKIAEGETAPNGRNQGNRRLFDDVNAFGGVKDGKEYLPFGLVNIAAAIGVSAEELADADTDEWLGKELYVTVSHEEKMTKESNYTKSFEPKEFKEKLKGYRSVDSVEASAAASTAVKSNTGAKATATGKKTFSL